MSDDETTTIVPLPVVAVVESTEQMSDYYRASADAAESFLAWAVGAHGNDLPSLQRALRSVDVYCKVRTTIGAMREKSTNFEQAWDPWGADPLDEQSLIEQAKERIEDVRRDAKSPGSDRQKDKRPLVSVQEG